MTGFLAMRGYDRRKQHRSTASFPVDKSLQTLEEPKAMKQSTPIRDSHRFHPATPVSRRRQEGRNVARLILTIMAAVAFQARAGHAQVIDWNNFTGVNAWFENPLNWTPAAIPGPGSALEFNSPNTYHVLWNPGTSAVSPTVHAIYVSGGGHVNFSNVNAAQQYQLEVLGGIGPAGNLTPLTVSYLSALTLNGMHLLCQGNVGLGQGTVVTINGNHPAGSRLTVGGTGFLSLDGTLNITGPNAVVTSKNSRLGHTAATHVTVSGAGARWDNSNNLYVGSGWANGNDDTLDILAGGVVTTVDTTIGEAAGPFYRANGTLTVSGTGSLLASSSDVVVGEEADGAMNITAGGLVTCTSGVIGHQSGSAGAVTVTGDDSRWQISDALTVGNSGSATLDIQDGGKVSVGPGGSTYIGAGGSVQISGQDSRFEFGQATMATFNQISGTGGSLAGTIDNSAYSAASDYTTPISSSVNLDDVRLVNSGKLYGDGSIRFGLENTSTGEVETSAGERMRFAGSGNINEGEINNFGGQIRFDHGMQNGYDGIVTGRGQFIADQGWSNNGVMAFSAGFTDILGDMNNQEGAKIVTTGNATTTFHDDVYNEVAGEIRTALGSSTVILGALTGTGNFTGLGTVFMEGDLRPGNSPGSMSFGGDLAMGESASLLAELGGLGTGEYDQLLVAGDLFLDGSQLDVALWNGFQLGNGMNFLIADIGGNRNGFFSGLGEGSLVGNFGGTDLFITYGAGNGNDIGLFTSAIPEPGVLGLVSLVTLGGCLIRRRRVAG